MYFCEAGVSVMQRRLLSPKHVAEETTLPLKRVYEGIHAGWIPSVKVGGRYYIAAITLDGLIRRIDNGELRNVGA